MNCTRNLLGVSWEQHRWHREVTSTEFHSSRVTDQWGREVVVEFVVCSTQEVCDACGTARGGGLCSCDADRAERCAARLAWLDEPPAARV